MKKMFSLALALIMALALCVPAMAAEITIDPQTPEDLNEATETFKAYKIFDATYTADDADFDPNEEADANISYTIKSDSPFYSVIANYTYDADGEGEGVAAKVFKLTATAATAAASVVTYNVEKIADYDAADLAIALKAVITDAVEPDGETNDLTDGKYELNGLDKGYYIILSSLGSKIIVQTLGAVEVVTKNEYPSIIKEISDNGAEYSDGPITVSIGDTVYYQLTMVVPATVNSAVTVHDVIEAGLTLNADYEAVDADGADVAFTVATPADSCDFELVFAADAVAGKTVTITYTAELNKEAEIVGETDDNADGIDTDGANTNEAWLTYSAYETPHDKVDALTYEVSFIKVIGDTENPLADVEFELYDDDGILSFVDLGDGLYRIPDDTETETVTTLVTPTDGVVEIEGLEGDATYTLKETKTVDGYNMLAENVDIKIGESNNHYAFDNAETEEVNEQNNVIRNYSGTVLPSTGGVGTTIFYVIGGVLMAGAAVLLVTKKKLANEQ